ncbi:hypothetical protein KKH3_16990 [Pectobacterium actinidiae]|nr:hypothetical protein KKH3_16990 [Pectobacterium actinidiae]
MLLNSEFLIKLPRQGGTEILQNMIFFNAKSVGLTSVIQIFSQNLKYFFIIKFN